jgi:predicted methyltransferase
MWRRVYARLPSQIQHAVFKGGQRSDRLRDPEAVIAALRVKPGDRVADLGPGYGHLTLALARAVAPLGVCYAADRDQETLDELARLARERDVGNLYPVLTASNRLELPEPVDLLFVSATYHHLRDPSAYFADARSQLTPGGRVAILESRLEGLLARQINPHGSVPAHVEAQMASAGFRLVETIDLVRGHWFGVFDSGVEPPD